MTKITTQELLDYREGIFHKQKVARLLEAILIQKQYLTKNNLSDEERITKRISDALSQNLFSELVIYFSQNGLVISLEDTLMKEITPYLRYAIDTALDVDNDPELIQKIRRLFTENGNLPNKEVESLLQVLEDENNKKLVHSIKEQYKKAANEYQFIGRITALKEIDLIELLVQARQYSKIVELIVSDIILPSQKTSIMEQLIEKHFEILGQIFESIPEQCFSSYSYDTEKKAYEQNLNKNLALALPNMEYIKGQLERIMITVNDQSEHHMYIMENFVKFLVEHNIIDPNQINWNQEDKTCISLSALAFTVGNISLGEYLYGLPNSDEMDSEIRENSDITIINAILEKEPWYISTFVESPNFQITVEKLKHIAIKIMQLLPLNPYVINDNQLNAIIKVFLEGATKENLNQIKDTIKMLKESSDVELLNKRRAEAVQALKNVSNSLLEQVPATKVIGKLARSKSGRWHTKK